MRVDDLLALNLCEEYNREVLVNLFGEGEFSWQEIYNCNIPIGDKIFCLFRPEFISEENIRSIGIELLKRAINDNEENYSIIINKILNSDINTTIKEIYDIYPVFVEKGIKLRPQSEWFLEEIVKCLQ